MKYNNRPFLLLNNNGFEDVNIHREDQDFLHNNDLDLNFLDQKIVLILSRIDDPEADIVGAMLASKGIYYLRVNSEDIVKETDVSLTINNLNDAFGYLKTGGITINIKSIDFVWIRHFHPESYQFPNNLSEIDKNL